MTDKPYSIIDIETTNLIGSYETLGDAEDDLIELNDPDFVIFEFYEDGRVVPVSEVPRSASLRAPAGDV